MSQYRRRLARRLLLLFLIVGQKRLRLVAQALGLVEIGLDARAALIEPLVDGAKDGASGEREEGDEGYRNPGFRIVQEFHQRCSRSAAAMAEAISARAGSTPVSRATSWRAASLAML